ncbi:MAG TPA: tetratricopeptide repeat-containing sensor histidine kinase [Pelobium sp.]
MGLFQYSLRLQLLKLAAVCMLLLVIKLGYGQSSAVDDSTKVNNVVRGLRKIEPNAVDSFINVTDKNLQKYSATSNLHALYKVNKTASYWLSKYGYLGLAEKYNLDAINLAKSLKNVFSQVNDINSLGVLYAKRGDFVKAESVFLSALLLAEKSKYEQGVAATYLKLGALRTRQNRIEEALAFYNKIDSLNALHHTHYNEGDLLGNKAIIYAIKGDLDRAESLFKKSYDLAVKEKLDVEQVLAYQNLGLLYKEKKQFKKAYETLIKGLDLAKQKGLKETALRLEVNIPLLLVEQKQFDVAEKRYLNLAARAKDNGLDDLVLEVYHNLVELAKEQQNYKSSFNYLLTYNKLNKVQQDAQQQRLLAEAAVSLGLYRANNEILENQNLLFQKTRERNILVAILIFIGLLLTILIFMLLRLRKINARLDKKRQQLAVSNNVKNKLFSIIGHDLRGHQGTSLGILNLLKDGDLNKEEAQLYLSMIIKQSESALSTLDDLLLWGKSQIKGEPHQKTMFEILPIIQSAINLNSEAVYDKRLSVNINSLENVSVYMDKNHFSFIIRNLLANAVKFTPIAGEINIYSAPFESNYIKLCVSDNGVGIDPEEIKSVFESYSTSKLGTNNETGTGFGLTLCKEFVNANGGEIWAEAKPTGGTVISFTCEKGKI